MYSEVINAYKDILSLAIYENDNETFSYKYVLNCEDNSIKKYYTVNNNG